MTIKHQRLMAYASCVLLLLQVITVLVSWVWGSVILDTNVSSLLTADGVRWFCSSLVDNVRSPLLIYILLIGLTAGQVKRSKILADLASFSTLPSFQRKAMTVALWEMAAILVVVAYLTLAPHAVLLSALGTLFPSSFSAFLVPLLCTMAGVASITYGCICGNIRSGSDVFDAAVEGGQMSVPYVIVYMLSAELYSSVCWVWGI